MASQNSTHSVERRVTRMSTRLSHLSIENESENRHQDGASPSVSSSSNHEDTDSGFAVEIEMADENRVTESTSATSDPTMDPVIKSLNHIGTACQIPGYQMTDLLKIWDFYHMFQEFIQMADFSIEELYDALTSTSSHNLLTELHAKLMKFFFLHGNEATFGLKAKPIYLFNFIIDYPHNYQQNWLEMTRHILQIKKVNSYLPDTLCDTINDTLYYLTPSTYPSSCPYEIKTEILKCLINFSLDLDTIKTFVKEMPEKIKTLKTNLTEVSGEKHQKLNTKKSSSNRSEGVKKSPTTVNAEIRWLDEEIDSLKLQLLTLEGTKCVGVGADGVQFWLFRGDFDRLYVRYGGEMEALWWLFDADDVAGLEKRYCERTVLKGVREGLERRKGLERVCELERERYECVGDGDVFGRVKQEVLEVEKDYTQSQARFYKEWHIDSFREMWMAEFVSCEDLATLVRLIKFVARRMFRPFWTESDEDVITYQSSLKFDREDFYLEVDDKVYNVRKKRCTWTNYFVKEECRRIFTDHFYRMETLGQLQLLMTFFIFGVSRLNRRTYDKPDPEDDWRTPRRSKTAAKEISDLISNEAGSDDSDSEVDVNAPRMTRGMRRAKTARASMNMDEGSESEDDDEEEEEEDDEINENSMSSTRSPLTRRMARSMKIYDDSPDADSVIKGSGGIGAKGARTRSMRRLVIEEDDEEFDSKRGGEVLRTLSSFAYSPTKTG